MTRQVRSTRAAGKVSIAVALSRILGLARELIFANLFGAGFYYDAWQVAFRIPNFFRDLFAEGAFSAAFVPTFTEFLHKKGRSEAWLLVNLVINALLVLLGSFAVILLLFPNGFVYLVATGFVEVPGKVEVTSTLVKILSPFLLLVALASVAMSVLNTLNRFFLPSLAPAFFNLAVILAGLFLVPLFERRGILPVYAMGVGAVLGGLLQFAAQWPLLHRQGYRFRFCFESGHQGLARIRRLLAPAVLGISAFQLSLVINTFLASFLGNGPLSWLSYAFRVFYLPIGLFGVAVGTVNLREVSVSAAQKNWEELKETVASSIKLVALLAVPSTIGLMILAVPIVELLFERGQFTHQDTLRTAYALIFYSLGLVAYSCIKVYVPTFYALEDTRTPVLISTLTVLIGVVLNTTLLFLVLPHLVPGYEYVGLAFGTTFSVTANQFLLARSFSRRLGSLSSYQVKSEILKTVVSAVIMGVVVFSLSQLFESCQAGTNLLEKGLSLATCMGVGALVYFGSCFLLRVEQARVLFPYYRH